VTGSAGATSVATLISLRGNTTGYDGRRPPCPYRRRVRNATTRLTTAGVLEGSEGVAVEGNRVLQRDGPVRVGDGFDASRPRTVTDEASGGTYTLVVELTGAADIEVGALGTRSLAAGWYAYTGSALGPGGFARVSRHRELAAGERSTRHWHVDYLLGHDAASVGPVTCSAGVDAECAVAGAIDGGPVEGFGCSDCGCQSHLRYAPRRGPLLASVAAAHAQSSSHQR